MNWDQIERAVGNHAVSLATVRVHRYGDGSALINLLFHPEELGLAPEQQHRARARLAIGAETAAVVPVEVLVRRRDGNGARRGWIEIERFTIEAASLPRRPEECASQVIQEAMRRGVPIARADLERVGDSNLRGLRRALQGAAGQAPPRAHGGASWKQQTRARGSKEP